MSTATDLADDLADVELDVDADPPVWLGNRGHQEVSAWSGATP